MKQVLADYVLLSKCNFSEPQFTSVDLKHHYWLTCNILHMRKSSWNSYLAITGIPKDPQRILKIFFHIPESSSISKILVVPILHWSLGKKADVKLHIKDNFPVQHTIAGGHHPLLWSHLQIWAAIRTQPLLWPVNQMLSSLPRVMIRCPIFCPRQKSAKSLLKVCPRQKSAQKQTCQLPSDIRHLLSPHLLCYLAEVKIEIIFLSCFNKDKS